MQAKHIYVRITICEMLRKIYYKEFYYNMNIIKMFMNNIIIVLLAVRICEDSDKRGSDSEDTLYISCGIRD